MYHTLPAARYRVGQALYDQGCLLRLAFLQQVNPYYQARFREGQTQLEPPPGRHSSGLLVGLPVVQLPDVGSVEDRVILERVPLPAGVGLGVGQLEF
jgi:hypothetical protein